MASPRADTFEKSRPRTSAAERNPEGPALGELLRSQRERRGLTLQQIASETKIPLRHLQAWEANELAEIPAGLYRRAEVRAYAQAVQLDQNEALAALERVLQTAPSVPTRSAASMVESSRSDKRMLIGLAVVGAFVVVWLATFGRELRGTETAQAQGAQAAEQPQHTSGKPAPGGEPPVASQPESEAPPVHEPTVAGPPPPAVEPPEQVEQPPISGPGTELFITSDPPGARVTVDGVGWGTTPVSVRHLPAGAKHVRVTKDGYRSEERVAPVTNDRRSMLHVTLESVR
jgi:transcriptional regulator with XRE-family HTH domain